MYRLYKNELSSPDNIVLKYTDEEGDLISMTGVIIATILAHLSCQTQQENINV